MERNGESRFEAGEFEARYARFQVGEADIAGENAPPRTVRAYEFIVDPSQPGDRRAVTANFALQALAAGYSPVMVPVVVPGVGFADATISRPLTSIYWLLQAPPSEPAPRPLVKSERAE